MNRDKRVERVRVGNQHAGVPMGNLAGVGGEQQPDPHFKWHEPWKKPQVGGSAVWTGA